MKDELGGEFATLRAKAYSHLTENNENNLNLKIIKTVQKHFNFEKKINQLEKNKVGQKKSYRTYKK